MAGRGQVSRKGAHHAGLASWAKGEGGKAESKTPPRCEWNLCSWRRGAALSSCTSIMPGTDGPQLLSIHAALNLEDHVGHVRLNLDDWA